MFLTDDRIDRVIEQTRRLQEWQASRGLPVTTRTTDLVYSLSALEGDRDDYEAAAE